VYLRIIFIDIGLYEMSLNPNVGIYIILKETFTQHRYNSLIHIVFCGLTQCLKNGALQILFVLFVLYIYYSHKVHFFFDFAFFFDFFFFFLF